MAKYLSITKEDLISFNPCNPEERLKIFGRHKSINAGQAFKLGVTVRDMLWVLGKVGHKDLCVEFSLLCAQRCAHNNTDPRVQAAIYAARECLRNRTPESVAAAWSAAESARSAEIAWQKSELLRLMTLEI